MTTDLSKKLEDIDPIIEGANDMINGLTKLTSKILSVRLISYNLDEWGV